MTGWSSALSRLIIAAFLLCGCASAHAEKRVALVVGNSTYQTVAKLPNPAADARLMSETLLSLGFFVVGGGAQLDLGKSGFEDALRAFSRELVGADVALFYYAGHGVETRGINYLVPVDAHPADEGDALAQMVGLSGVLEQMEKSGARLNLMLLDACRNNPLSDHGILAATGGLAQMQAPPGTLISFATQPHSVAYDGDDGHSPYTLALSATMRHPGYGLFRTFNEVGLAVEKATGGQQLPWVASSPIGASFYFAGKPAPADRVATATVPAAIDALAPLSEQVLRRDLVTDCDRLAAMPYDTGLPPGLPGVFSRNFKIAEAASACDDAMRRYPEVVRFAFEAGRIALARKDYTEARRLYDKAAAAGYPMAMHHIGVLYAEGEGVPRSRTEAARWYAKALAADEPLAKLEVAWLYSTGEGGVGKNCAEAIRLNEEAIKAEIPAAMNNLGLLYMHGRCVQRDYAAARRLFEQGAALNDDASMNSLAVIYYDGDGVPRDRRRAHELFVKAAALGNSEARQNLAEKKR